MLVFGDCDDDDGGGGGGSCDAAIAAVAVIVDTICCRYSISWMDDGNLEEWKKENAALGI